MLLYGYLYYKDSMLGRLYCIQQMFRGNPVKATECTILEFQFVEERFITWVGLTSWLRVRVHTRSDEFYSYRIMTPMILKRYLILVPQAAWIKH